MALRLRIGCVASNLGFVNQLSCAIVSSGFDKDTEFLSAVGALVNEVVRSDMGAILRQ